MDFEIWIGLGAAILVPLVLAWTSKLQSRIAATERDLSKFMIKAAETYITKSDLNSFEKSINARLQRLEEKIDSLLELK